MVKLYFKKTFQLVQGNIQAPVQVQRSGDRRITHSRLILDSYIIDPFQFPHNRMQFRTIESINAHPPFQHVIRIDPVVNYDHAAGSR